MGYFEEEQKITSAFTQLRLFGGRKSYLKDLRYIPQAQGMAASKGKILRDSRDLEFDVILASARGKGQARYVRICLEGSGRESERDLSWALILDHRQVSVCVSCH
jgi:hypothetical protein